jgi:predicted dehydrogenase
MPIRPEIVAVCNRTLSPEKVGWFTEQFSTVGQVTGDYRELLANPDVEAVYVALPHHLHEEVYCAALEAGKHLMGEKPFGIDRVANEAISACIEQHPECFVRCVSQFVFIPAVQRVAGMIEREEFGQLLEVNVGFLHSSDLNPDKPINWKRMIECNGEYGCMGDLGMHVCFLPFRAGWRPRNVRGVLSNVMRQRPDGKGGQVSCETWDNATLLCEAGDAESDQEFPMAIKTQRIAPGEKNTWYVEILGTQKSVRFSTKRINSLELLEYEGEEQAWQRIDMGYETVFQTISGGIFEFGFSDALLQMWAAYLYELHHGQPISRFAGCVRPEEVAYSHRLFTAALESQRKGSVELV